MKMDKKKLIIGIIVAVALLAFVFPKQVGRGSCGMCELNEYKWIEKSCLGITANSLIIVQAVDKPGSKDCYGLVYGAEKCYNTSETPRAEVSCG